MYRRNSSYDNQQTLCWGVLKVPIGHVDVTGDKSGPLNPRLDLYSHSPTGFGWGYMGSGASQLALAILADHYGKAYESLDRALYQAFKERVIAPLEWGQTIPD